MPKKNLSNAIIGDVKIHFDACKTCKNTIGTMCTKIRCDGRTFQLMITNLNEMSVVCVEYKKKDG